MKWRLRTGLVVGGLTAGLLMIAGCGDDDGVGSNTNHVMYADAAPQQDASNGNCDRNGFTAATQLATYQSASSFLRFEAYSSEDFPTDRVSVQIYDSFGGPSTPGSYTLEGSADDNYETCGLCPLIYVYSSAGEPDKIFYADTGTVEISAIGTIGGTFAATFHNLIFREVTIDSSSYRSTPVPGGEEWCINGFSFNETIEDDTAVCAQPGTCIGDNVSDFNLVSCETGNTVSTATLLSGNNALWVNGSHEW